MLMIQVQCKRKKEQISLLIRVKEENERAGLRLNIKKKKTNIVASVPITSWKIEGEKVELVEDFLFLDI